MSTITAVASDVEIGQLVDRLMRRVHVELNRKAPEFDPERIGPAGGMILMALADIQPAPMHELVRLIARDKSQVTRVLQSLHSKGLITREPSSQDGRVCVISLTEKGEGMVAKLRRVLTETIETILSPLDASEREQLTALLRKGVG